MPPGQAGAGPQVFDHLAGLAEPRLVDEQANAEFPYRADRARLLVPPDYAGVLETPGDLVRRHAVEVAEVGGHHIVRFALQHRRHAAMVSRDARTAYLP